MSVVEIKPDPTEFCGPAWAVVDTRHINSSAHHPGPSAVSTPQGTKGSRRLLQPLSTPTMGDNPFGPWHLAVGNWCGMKSNLASQGPDAGNACFSVYQRGCCPLHIIPSWSLSSIDKEVRRVARLPEQLMKTSVVNLPDGTPISIITRSNR